MATLAPTPRITQIKLASATAGPFDVGFRLFSRSIKVHVDDVLLSPAAYTLNAVFQDGFSDGASVTLDNIEAANAVVTIESAYVIERQNDYLPTDRGMARKINAEFGAAWAAMGDLRRDLQQQALDEKANTSDLGKLAAKDQVTTEDILFESVTFSKMAQDAKDSLRDRATHTGVQPIEAVDGLPAALDGKVDASDLGALSGKDKVATEDILFGSITFPKMAQDAKDALRDRATHTGTQPIETVAGLPAALDAKASAEGLSAVEDPIRQFSGISLGRAIYEYVDGDLYVSPRALFDGAHHVARIRGGYLSDRLLSISGMVNHLALLPTPSGCEVLNQSPSNVAGTCFKLAAGTVLFYDPATDRWGWDNVSAQQAGRIKVVQNDGAGVVGPCTERAAIYASLDIKALQKKAQIGFVDRAAAVAYIADQSENLLDGAVVEWRGRRVGKLANATAIPDMPDFVPFAAPLHVEHFGDNTTPGVTDMHGAFVAAIAYLRSIGGGDLHCHGHYAVSDEVWIDTSGIRLWGLGAGDFRGAPSLENTLASANSKITAIGDRADWVGKSVVRFMPAQGDGGGDAGGAQGILISGQGLSDSSLRLASWKRGYFKNLALLYSRVANLDLDVLMIPEYLSDLNYDTQRNRFVDVVTSNLNFPACNSAYGLRTQAYENVGGENPDPNPDLVHNPNVSFNVFESCRFQSNQQHATWLSGATDNIFMQCTATVAGDPNGNTYYGWPMLAVEQDARLQATITKRNYWLKCSGWIHCYAGQSGGRSPKFNQFVSHRTSVRSAFGSPVSYQTPAGGSDWGEVTMNLDAGDLGTSRRFAEFAEISSARQYENVAAVSVTVDMAAGGALSVNVPNAIPPGAIVTGVTSRVKNNLSGATGYAIGTAADPDRWGISSNWQAGTTTDNTDWTSGVVECFPQGSDILISRKEGSFNGGSIVLALFYRNAISEV